MEETRCDGLEASMTIDQRIPTALFVFVCVLGCGEPLKLWEGDAGTENNSDNIIKDFHDTETVPDSNPGVQETAAGEKLFDGDPGKKGPYDIKTVCRKINGQDATLYIPVEDDGTLGEGPFPLVIVHPGYQASHTMYSHFTNHIVSHGFFGVGIGFPGDNHENCAKHTISVIDWLLSDDNPHRSRIEESDIITAGHSMGGKIAIYAAALDSRITNVLAWDPVDTGGPPCDIDPVACKRWSVTPELMPDVRAKLLIFGGMVGASLSCTPKGETHHDYFSEVTGTALHVDFPKSDHLDWPDDAGEGIMGTLGSLICGGRGKTLGKTVHRISEQIQGAWLLKYVLGYTNLDGYLNGDALVKEIHSGILKMEHLP